VGNCIPESRGFEILFFESGITDIDTGIQQRVGRLNTVSRSQSPFSDLHAATQMKPVSASFVSETQKNGILFQTPRHVVPLQVFHKSQHSCFRNQRRHTFGILSQ